MTPEAPTKLTPLLARLAQRYGWACMVRLVLVNEDKNGGNIGSEGEVGWDENLLVYKVVISRNLLTRRLLSLELDY